MFGLFQMVVLVLCNCVLGESRKLVIILVLVIVWVLVGMVMKWMLLRVFVVKLKLQLFVGNLLLVVFCWVCRGLNVSDRWRVFWLSMVFICVGDVGKFLFVCYRVGCSVLRQCYSGVVIVVKVVGCGGWCRVVGWLVSVISSCFSRVVLVKFGGCGQVMLFGWVLVKVSSVCGLVGGCGVCLWWVINVSWVLFYGDFVFLVVIEKFFCIGFCRLIQCQLGSDLVQLVSSRLVCLSV